MKRSTLAVAVLSLAAGAVPAAPHNQHIITPQK
jgi:hypothetical protein